MERGVLTIHRLYALHMIRHIKSLLPSSPRFKTCRPVLNSPSRALEFQAACTVLRSLVRKTLLSQLLLAASFLGGFFASLGRKQFW